MRPRIFPPGRVALVVHSMWVLQKVDGAGESLASSFNIAAFNLGNALGAWLGGVVVDHGPGSASVTWAAAILPGTAILIALASIRLEGHGKHGETKTDKESANRACNESPTA